MSQSPMLRVTLPEAVGMMICLVAGFSVKLLLELATKAFISS